MSLVPLALAAAVAIAACGGGGGNSSTTTSSSKAASAPSKPKATPVQLVDQTFTASNAVQSGHLDLTATVTLNGVKQLGSQPITVHVSGPFVQGANGKPNTALTISLSLAGKNLDLAVDQIDGTSYLGISGTFYKLPASALKPPAGATGAAGRLKGLFTSLGIDPRHWLTNPHDVGTADVGGVSTEHLTAQVNLPKLLADVTRLAAGLSSSASGVPSLPSGSLSQISQVLKAAQLDVYTGIADHLIRRIHVTIALGSSASVQSVLNGFTGGSVDFDVTLTQLNQAQTITAPANAQPFSAASGALGGLLAGLGGGSLGGALSGATG